MKVAHLDTGRTWRGGQAQALLLMRELRARGVSQLLLSPPGPLADRALDDGFERERLGAAGRARACELGTPAAVGRQLAEALA